MSSESPKEYQHVEFSFTRSSGLLDGKSFDVTAYLLVPVEALPEFEKWSAAEAAGKKDNPGGFKMYRDLTKQGALLHREDGPAYREVEKSVFDKQYSKVTEEQYWEKGVRKESAAPRVRPLGRYTL